MPEPTPAGLPAPTVSLLCPATRLPLTETTLGDAEVAAGSPLTPPKAPLRGLSRSGRVLLRSDAACAYPFHGEVPVALAPEALLPRGSASFAQPTEARYREAYDEVAYYDRVARGWARDLRERLSDDPRPNDVDAPDEPPAQALMLVAAARALPSTFPDPAEVWLHLRFEGLALRDAYAHLAPLVDTTVLQIGGVGLDAVKFLLLGAREVWLATPVPGEHEFAIELARACGAESRFQRVVAVAEELPFADGTFDAVYAGGSIHHTVTGLALPECARVLRSGGAFAAVEPWRGPGYGLGTRLLGKREPVHCRPLDARRVEALHTAFSNARVMHHGALTRYPALALERLGVRLPAGFLHTVMRMDDAITARAPRIHRTGSSVALLAER